MIASPTRKDYKMKRETKLKENYEPAKENITTDVTDFTNQVRTLLLEITYMIEQQVYHFKFTGTARYEQRFGETSVDLYDLCVIEVVNGVDTPFSPKGHTWAGRKLAEYDAIAEVLFKYCVKNTDVGVLYMDIKLQSYIDVLTADTISKNDIVLPKKILYGQLLNTYELYLVTDKYTYYALGDSFLMLDTESRSIVADNYFAEVGFSQSEEAIKEGVEKLYFCAYEFDCFPFP